MLPNAKLLSCAQKYRTMRTSTRDLLEDEALRAFGLRVDVYPVDDAALDAVDRWNGRLVAFPWRERLIPVLEKSHPRRLDLALWSGGQLCGLAIARLSDAKEWISLTHAESNPEPHALKGRVIPLVLTAAQIYATLVQAKDSKNRCPKVRILNPLPEARAWYAACGFGTLVRANGYTFVVP